MEEAKSEAGETKVIDANVNPTIEQMTSEQLGLALNGQYNTLMQVQQNIIQINKELEKRQAK